MMFLAYIAALIVYLIIFTSVVVMFVKFAKKQGKSPKVWGWSAAFIMYNLVFWDFLPTLITYQYYCAKDSGFWVYKTAEQWRKENLGVVVGSVKLPKGIVLDKGGSGEQMMKDGARLVFKNYGVGEQSLWIYNSKNSRGYWMNDHIFYGIETKENQYLPVRININTIVDDKSKEVLIKRVTVDAGSGRSLKVWNFIDDCGPTVNTEKPFYKAFENINN